MWPQASGISYTAWFSRTQHRHGDCLRSIPFQENSTWLSSQCANELCLFLTFGCLFYQISLSHSSHCFLFHVLEHRLSCIFYPPESNVCLFVSKHQSVVFTNSKWWDMDFLPSPGRVLSTWKRWPVGITHSLEVNYRSCSWDIDKNSD